MNKNLLGLFFGLLTILNLVFFIISYSNRYATKTPSMLAAKSETRQTAEAMCKLTIEHLVRDKDLVKAEAEFNKTAELDPSYAMPLFYLGTIAQKQENWQKAIQNYEQYCKLDNHSDFFVQAQLQLDVVRKLAQQDSTLEGKRQRQYEAALQNARIMAKAGRLLDATSQIDQAIIIDGTRWEGYALRGSLLAQQNNTNDAITALDKSIELAPEEKKVVLQRLLARCQSQPQATTLAEGAKKDVTNGDYADAAEKFAQAYKLVPQKESWGMSAAMAYAVLKDYAKSQTLFQTLSASQNPNIAKQAQANLADLRRIEAETQRLGRTSVPTSHLSVPHPVVPPADLMGIKFVIIKGGIFMMGSAANETGAKDDEDQHKVTIGHGFQMSTTTVTQQQWLAVMGTQPWAQFPHVQTGDDYPTVGVTWSEAVEFCHKLSEKKHEIVYRLPTEAEWEYACRAGTRGLFGLKKVDANLPAEKYSLYFWYDGNRGFIGESYPAQVGRKRCNDWGLYDMHGNVWQWCSDWYGTYKIDNVNDPTGPDTGMKRILRGGSWHSKMRDCRAANRDAADPSDRRDDIGFRVVAVGQ